MKKVLSVILASIGFIGTMVTIFGGEEMHNIAKKVTIFAFFILVIIILFVVHDYVKDKIRKLKNLFQEFQAIKKQLDIEKIKKMTDSIEQLNSKVVKLDNSLSKVMEKTTDFNQTCNQTREKVNECQEEIIAKLNDKSYFQYHTTDVTTQLKQLLDTNKEIDEIRIICFGRSGYGEIVQHIEEKNLPVNVKIIICNPIKNEFICNKNDYEKIRDLIDVMNRINAEIFLSDIPPAIRASTVYIKGEAIWSATQSYQFKRRSNEKIELTRPKESLIVTCDERNSKRDFNGIVKCFESEYDRLLESSKSSDKVTL